MVVAVGFFPIDFVGLWWWLLVFADRFNEFVVWLLGFANRFHGFVVVVIGLCR